MTGLLFVCTANACRSQMAEGSADDVLGAFRAARDEILERVRALERRLGADRPPAGEVAS